MTWTMLTMWPFFPTLNIRCRKTPTVADASSCLESFTYLRSIIENTREAEADVRACIGKVRAASQQLNNVWRSSLLSISTKIKIFNTTI